MRLTKFFVIKVQIYFLISDVPELSNNLRMIKVKLEKEAICFKIDVSIIRKLQMTEI